MKQKKVTNLTSVNKNYFFGIKVKFHKNLVGISNYEKIHIIKLDKIFN